MGFDVRTLEIDDISRAQKQNVRVDTAYDSGSVFDEANPLKGVTRNQRARTENVGDVLNIGAGTRCTYCGMLHFMWRADCGACGKPMEFNKGHRDEVNRL
jgi:hypothetical protein|tara:strand:- start:650 stop:949 length:300 start_codon:yes stop_codon:yes gene_type:complete